MTGVSQRVWLRIVVALCVAVLGLSVSASASVDKKPPKCFGKKATIVGTNKSEKLKGTSGDDVIVAKGGNDTIKSKSGNDLVCAGPGDDTVKASGGNDRVLGESGRDKLYADVGNDSVDGGADDDIIDGGTDADTLLGGDGADVVTGGTGVDKLDGGSGNDKLDGGTEGDALLGGDGVDTLTGGTGADNLDGGPGNDTVDGGVDNDVVKGSAGADTLTGSLGNDTLDGGADADTVDGGDGNDSAAGGTGADTLTGSLGNDTLDGGADADLATGGAGVDALVGGDGADRLIDDSADVDSFDGQGGIDLCTHGVEDTVAVGCDFDQDDRVIFAPYQGATSPSSIQVQSTAAAPAIDLYTLIDRSGSMSGEITSIKNNLGTVVNQLKCTPVGTGTPPNCIEDLWAGAGTLGYSGAGGAPYTNHLDIQPNPNFSSSIPTTEPGGCCAEPTTFATWETITGLSGTPWGFSGVTARSCTGSPANTAGLSGYGYPCFRPTALSLVALATDEGPLSGGDTNHVPDWATVVKPAMLARQARLIGVYGSGSAAGVITDLQTMATDTGAVDPTNANAPLVFNGADSTAANSIKTAILTFVQGLKIKVAPSLFDDPSDAVQAVNAFAQRVETDPGGTPSCADATDVDTNADTFPDTYVDVLPSTSLCWRVIPKTNTTVPATGADQVFTFYVNTTVEGVSPQLHQPVYVVVPAA